MGLLLSGMVLGLQTYPIKDDIERDLQPSE